MRRPRGGGTVVVVVGAHMGTTDDMLARACRFSGAGADRAATVINSTAVSVRAPILVSGRLIPGTGVFLG